MHLGALNFPARLSAAHSAVTREFPGWGEQDPGPGACDQMGAGAGSWDWPGALEFPVSIRWAVGGEELACHALPPCHMAAHGCISRPSQRAAVAQASGGSIFGLATAVRAVSAALSSHDGDTLAAAPAALQLNGEGADDMRHSNMHMSGFDALLMQCAKRNSGAALVRC